MRIVSACTEVAAHPSIANTNSEMRGIFITRPLPKRRKRLATKRVSSKQESDPAARDPSVVPGDERRHAGRDRFAPAAAVEDAVMADALRQHVPALRGRDAAAQVLRRQRLAGRRDVVEFAL